MPNLRKIDRHLSLYKEERSDKSCSPIDLFEDDGFVPPEKWLNHSDILIAIFGAAVGLSNAWRFPFYCYIHGGGAFLVAYFLSFLVIGVPIVVLEIALSQFTSAGLYHNMDLIPAFKGIGISCGLMTYLFIIEYNVDISWAIYYFFVSLGEKDLPWATCGNWSSQLCETKLTTVNDSTCSMDPSLVLYPNGTCYNRTTNVLYGISDKAVAKSFKIVPHLPAEDYLKAALPHKESDNDFTTGNIRWKLPMCLLVAWIVQYFFLISGVAKSNTFIRYTTYISYTLLVFLFIFGIMQEGSDDGIRLYLNVNITKLTEPQLWTDAVLHITYSIGTLTGIYPVFASRNTFHVNLIRDSILVCLIDTLSSLYTGFVYFHFIGGFAKVRNVDIASLVLQSKDVIFVIVPQAFSVFPLSSLLSVVFFAMVSLLGMKAVHHYIFACVMFVSETSSFLKKNKLHIASLVCYSSFMIGLLATSDGGTKVLEIMKYVAYNWNVFVLAGLYCVSVMIYGPFRISKDIEIMLDEAKSCTFILPWKYLKWYFISCWCVITPTFMSALVLCEIFEAVHTGKSTSAQIFMAFFRTAIILIPIPIVFVRKFAKAQGTFTERVKTIFRPSIKWGPYLVKHRRLVTYVKDFRLNPRNLPDDSV